MIKFRLCYHKDDDIAWLNQLAQEGYAMTGFFAGFWRFDPCAPGEYAYQIDLSDRFIGVSNDYLELMRDTGIEYIGKFGFWIVLRKKKSDEPFVLYSDVESKLAHYQKIRFLFKVATIVEMICFLLETLAAANGTRFAYYVLPVILIIILAMLRTITRTDAIIATLKEQNGDPADPRRHGADPVLLTGLLTNCAALLLKDTVPQPIGLMLQIAALFLMLVGIYRSRQILRPWDE